MKSWSDALRAGVMSGAIASAVSTGMLSICGQRETGAPYAPTNAISHWIWGDHAASRRNPSARYTAVGYFIHHASSTFWAVFYEKWFGRRAERGEAAVALAGGAGVAALACFVDYKMTPRRLQPGFERCLSARSLAMVYATFGVALALRGLAASRARHVAP